jgi:predicted RNA methylase
VGAFLAGTQLAGPFASFLSKLQPVAVTESKPFGGSVDIDKPFLDNDTGEKLYAETATVGKNRDTRTFKSTYLDAELVVPAGVFMPGEAEGRVLPLMSRHRELFAGKQVLEIGGGSGPISIYAAKLGAARVVVTDISPEAVAAIEANAERLGVADRVEARLVSLDDMSAFSVIRPDEVFDVIISNPPYALDLNAPVNTAAVDTGELGFSIVRGFSDHLHPDGIALLFYDSLFYHQVMNKFARYNGYEVISHNPIGMYTWEAETLFNNYLQQLLVKESMPVDAFRFVRDTDGLNWVFMRNQCLDTDWIGYPQLIPGSDDKDYHAGWMAIRHPNVP